MNEQQVIEAHRDSGRTFSVGSTRSFVLDEGDGTPVLCMHGVPASSYLYRKLVSEIAIRGLRGIAFDLPGLGLADRPTDFDYSWTGLGRFAAAAVDALDLDRFHLVVHDIGGPIGFELAAAMPDRIRSLTILNTLIDVDTFTKPWSMRPFAVKGLGEAWLRGMVRPAFRALMRMQGIADTSAVTNAELDAYVGLLTREDGGKAFLQIMRGFEPTKAKAELYRSVVSADRYPRQVIWGVKDPALRWDTYGVEAVKATGVDGMRRLPGKHFLQEDNAPAIADLLATFIQGIPQPDAA